MHINHIAIYTNNLEDMKNFYVKYFGFKSGNKYIDKSFSSYFLRYDDKCSLELMSNDNLRNDPKIDLQTGYVHIAISVGSKEEVVELTNRLLREGFLVVSNPRITGDGYFESVILDPDGNRVEITI